MEYRNDFWLLLVNKPESDIERSWLTCSGTQDYLGKNQNVNLKKTSTLFRRNDHFLYLTNF